MALLTKTVGGDSVSVADALTATRSLLRKASDSVIAIDALTVAKIVALLISNARALNPTRVRIDFSAPALASEALSEPSSYIFTNVSPGSVEIVPLAVRLPPGQINPLYVEIDVSEHTGGSVYEVALSTAIRGVAGEVGSLIPFEYTGEGSSPIVTLVLATSPTEVQVFFSSETMLDNAAINDVERYEWDNDLITVAVKRVVGNVVILRTTTQIPGTLYTLTVLGEILGELFIDGVSLVVDDIPLVISS